MAFDKLKDRRILITIFSALIILIAFSIAFLIFRTNFIAFFFLTCLGIIPIFFFSRNKKIGLVVGGYAGFFGFLTEWWGCSLGYWTWINTQSLYMVFGIFPVEMPIIYFFCGLWINQFLNEIYIEEIEDFRNNMQLQISKPWLIFLFITTAICYLTFIISPIWIQSMLILSTGLILMASISKRKIILSLGGITGVAGFFFENFATGGFLPDLIIWRYNFVVHQSAIIPDPIIVAAPISAIIAYFGTGLIMGSLIFIGTKVFISSK